jgi:cold shock CspA family protein
MVMQRPFLFSEGRRIMDVPLEITYRNVEKTDALDALIRKKVQNLEKVCSYLNSCRIAVEKAQHDHAGNPYRVRINMTVPPGHELAVTRNPGEGDSSELPQIIRKAFEAARRQLKTLVEKQRGEVKTHPAQETVGIVTKLFPEEEYGFLQRPDGREIYFHAHSVLQDDFSRLEVGTGVRFVEEMGESGPQASTVQIVDKPGVRIGKA